jgi:uncharacterized protein
MRILNCLLILCIFLSASCSKPVNTAEKFSNKGRLAYSKKNYKEAFEYYKKAAELGDAKGMGRLARMYFSGEYVKENYTESFKWLKKAAESGHCDAMFILGLSYYYGWEPIIRDYGEAIKWWKKAAELGNADAMIYLGNIYDGSYDYKDNVGIYRDDRGTLDNTDNHKAFKWYKKAAELGNTKGMYHLGRMYYLGDGVLPFKVFNQVSFLGHTYYLGDGLLWKDPKKAKYWIKKSYEAGNKNAEKAWNTLELWKY